MREKQKKKTIKLPTSLTTVTPLSKYLAMMLFISLPFLGFYFGMQYQKNAPMRNIRTKEIVEQRIRPDLADSSAADMEKWKSYINKDLGFRLNHPDSIIPAISDYGGNNYFL
jgi:hypothetical protein